MKRNSSAMFVAKGASYLFIQHMGSTIISVAAFPFIARLISQAEMGILAALILVVGVYQIMANLGLACTATKFVVEYMGKGDHQTALSVFYQILWLKLFSIKSANSMPFEE